MIVTSRNKWLFCSLFLLFIGFLLLRRSVVFNQQSRHGTSLKDLLSLLLLFDLFLKHDSHSNHVGCAKIHKCIPCCVHTTTFVLSMFFGVVRRSDKSDRFWRVFPRGSRILLVHRQHQMLSTYPRLVTVARLYLWIHFRSK